LKKSTSIIIGAVLVLGIASAVILSNSGVALADIPRGGFILLNK
jgi:hypothetical protein